MKGITKSIFLNYEGSIPKDGVYVTFIEIGGTKYQVRITGLHTISPDVINDELASLVTTYSSTKIEQLLQDIEIDINDIINDSIITTDKTWSSSKIAQIYAPKAILAPLFPPIYTVPTVVLSSTQSSSNLEVGQVINIPLTSNFTQNDAGALNGTSIQKDNVEISTLTSYTDTGVIMSTTPKVYKSIASYQEGIIKDDIFGDPFPTGHIPAGSIISNLLSYRGYYYTAFGATSANPTNSAEARTLPQSQLSNVNTGILNSGTTLLKQVIVSKRALSSVIDLDASNQNITSQYIEISTNFTVNDASGNPVSGYFLYIRTQGSPYVSNHRHQFTLI